MKKLKLIQPNIVNEQEYENYYVADEINKNREAINELIDLAEKIEMETTTSEPKKWKPEKGEDYYCLSHSGDILKIRSYDNKNRFDIDTLNFGNCFQTKELAGNARDKIKELLK